MNAVAERIVRLCKRRSYGEIRKAVTDRSSSGPTSLDMCFENVSKVYLARGRKVVAVNGVSFTCAQGRFTTVLGASGCGKSTLLSIAAGLVSADGGAVTLGGRPVKEPSPERGMVFQHYALFPWLSVKDNVGFSLRYKSLKGTKREAAVRHALELVGLERFADALPKELSGGMKQRCALARALAAEPAVLLMDEPFGALDAMTRERLQQELLRVVGQEGLTVCFVTHDVDEAIYLSTDIVVMDEIRKCVKAKVEVALPWPREPAMRVSGEFVEMKRIVWSELHAREQATS